MSSRPVMSPHPRTCIILDIFSERFVREIARSPPPQPKTERRGDNTRGKGVKGGKVIHLVCLDLSSQET